MLYYTIFAGIASLIGLWVWWTLRKGKQNEDEHQMLSFVALLKEPQHLEAIYVATAARKAWNADLGDGNSEGEDGFVVGGEDPLPTIAVKFRDRMLLVNNFACPYVQDPENAAASIADLRLQELVGKHTAWMSCDALGVESFDDDSEVREWYRVLGRLLSELVDENCLAILLPQTGQIFANMEETLDLLKSTDPLEALADDAPVPIVPISDDDPRMEAAVRDARHHWPEFVKAFEEGQGDNFSVKAPICHGGKTEFIWMEVTAIENGVIYGKLANEPMDLGPLKLGSKITTSEDEVNDWAYFAGDEPHGLYTVKVLGEASQEHIDDA